MSARVYVLLDVAQGELASVVRTLRDRPGVIMADIVEGPPNIVMVVEAHRRRRLAELTVEALGSIEGVTENLQLLPVIANRTRPFLPKPFTDDLGKSPVSEEERQDG